MSDTTEVSKLGTQQREHCWLDADGTSWRWTEAAWWQFYKVGMGWCGSYATVEGAPPYARIGVISERTP